MLIRVAPDLSEFVVCADQAGQENILGAGRGTAEPLAVWRCERPVLLTDTARISQLEPGLRDAVLSLYESYPWTVTYDGTSVGWSPIEYPKVWCPNIDTLFFARTLRRAPGRRAQLRRGRLRLGVSRQARVDARPRHRARVCLRYQPRRDPLRLRHAGRSLDNACEGLGLLARFARRGRELPADDGLLLLNISTLAGERPLAWFDEHGWQFEVLDRMRVPLKVNAVTSGRAPEAPAWYDYLSARGAIPAEGERGYRLWHELRMYACRPKH